MKFSESTVNVLKAFSLINKSIQLKSGQVISTVSPQKSIMAKADIDEQLADGCFYDLNRFLSVLTLFEEPTFTFQEKFVNIRDKKNSVNYTFSDPSQIITPPQKEIQLPSVDVTCDVKWDDINNALKAAIVLGLPEIAFKSSDGSAIELAAIDTRNPTADQFEIQVGSNDSRKVFKAIFKIETLKLMNRDYKVEISSKGIAKFTSLNDHGPKLTYWVAMEEKSSFEG